MTRSHARKASHILKFTSSEAEHHITEEVKQEPLYLNYQQREPKALSGVYRKCELPLPKEISEATGISVFGRTLKSSLFSTDPYVIRNTDADAILAVAPFTCQPAIIDAIIQLAERPVFVGVAGTVTQGKRSQELAREVEWRGAAGVCASIKATCETIRDIAIAVDIPLVVTIANYDALEAARIESGADIINVAAGKNTAEVVAQVRSAYPNMPIMATGGTKAESIRRTIAAGADCLSWTPPSLAEIEKQMMANNRIKTITA